MSNKKENGCTGQPNGKNEELKKISGQPTPFNIGTFGVLFVFCIIIALTSSLYYNWPAIERILVDDKVFQNLCTKDEIYNAIDGMFVCDEQRKQIGNLALIIFYTEFIAFAIGGLLTDIIGVYIVLVLGFMFGFAAFLILYFYHFSNGMIKIAFAHWGMFGGFVFITSIQFPKMFPEATSLADGMIILFDNISGLMPIIIYKLMKNFNLKYYEAFGTYILWGIIPSFLLVITFIPYKIMPKNQSSNNDVFKCMDTKLKDHKLWTNYIVFSIPVTCSIFYKKTFSTYFLKNQTLVKIFPIIMLFVFVPTIFIAALNQFMGVHITSCILYIFYIISFVCFLYPTKQYGLLSIILFVISTSAAEQQTMTYISENHPYNESTLLGISYAVDFIVGSVLQRIFDRIFDRSPMSILFVIIPLFIICIGYSLYCAANNNSQKSGRPKSLSFRGLFLMLWIIPFIFLCITITIKSINRTKSYTKVDIPNVKHYDYQKNITVSTIMYSFSFYYVCNVFLVITSIIKASMNRTMNRKYFCLILLASFLIIPQFFIYIHLKYINEEILNITSMLVVILIFKIVLYIFSNSSGTKYMDYLFCIFLMIYGFVFFLFIYMLAYYNLQMAFLTTYSTRISHWGSMLTMFMLLRFLYHILSQFHIFYLVLSGFNIFFFIYFAIVLYLYLPYEIDMSFMTELAVLQLPVKLNTSIETDHIYYIESATIIISLCNFGLLIDLIPDKKMVLVFFFGILIHRLIIICYIKLKGSLSDDYIKYIIEVLSGISLINFLILSYCRMNIKNFQENKYVSILVFVNFVILSIYTNFGWVSIQDKIKGDKGPNKFGQIGDLDSIEAYTWFTFFSSGMVIGWTFFIIYMSF